MVDVRALTARRFLRIDDGALGQAQLDRPEAAAVGRDGGVGEGAHGEARRGQRTGRHAIERSLGLRTGALEVELDVAALHRDGDLDADRLVELDTVIVEVIDEAIGSLGDGAERLAGHDLRTLQEFVEDRGQLVVAVAVGELGQPAPRHRAGRDLGIEVAHHRIGYAHILADHLDQRVVEDAGVAQLQGRNPQPLLVDLRCVGRHRSRRHAADVLMVCHGAAQRDDLAAMKDRRDDGDVGQVRAAGVGVVQDVDVAVAHAVDGIDLEHLGDRRDEGRQMDRDRAGLRERGAVGGEQAGGSVESFLDDGREGTAQQRRLHLVGDAVELVANDFDRDGVEGFGLCRGCHGLFPQSAVMIRLPSATTVARQPGSIKVVVSGCSTMAGPRISRPIAIADRS